MSLKENKSGVNDAQLLRKNIGLFIRELRVNNFLTGAQLGKLINVSQQQISRYENGVTSISIETLSNILQVLGSEWNEFYYKVLAHTHHDINRNNNVPFLFL